MVAHPMAAFQDNTATVGQEPATETAPAGGFGFLPGAATRPPEARRPSPRPELLRARRDGQALGRLALAIETEIVPRLVMAHPVGAETALARTGAGDVAAFVGLMLRDEGGGATAYIEALRARGTTLDQVYLDLLAPAARRLGEMWEEDLCDFTTVTLSLRQLHHMLHAFRPAFVQERRQRSDSRRALLSPVPGEQHSFGVAMVGEFLRRAGWDVTDGLARSRTELAGLVRSRWFTLVGLSIGAEANLDSLAAAIRAIRRASSNPGIGIMVGGRVFIDRPDLVGLVGADATARDGRQVVLQAEQLRRHQAEPART